MRFIDRVKSYLSLDIQIDGKITHETLRNLGLDPLDTGLARFIPEKGVRPAKFLRLPIEQILSENFLPEDETSTLYDIVDPDSKERPRRFSPEAAKTRILFAYGILHYDKKLKVIVPLLIEDIMPLYERVYNSDTNNILQRFVRSLEPYLLKKFVGEDYEDSRRFASTYKFHLKDDYREKRGVEQKAAYNAAMLVYALDKNNKDSTELLNLALNVFQSATDRHRIYKKALALLHEVIPRAPHKPENDEPSHKLSAV